MTQQNAALVEQSAAAAESLKDQAQRLAVLVQAFRVDGASASSYTPVTPLPSATAAPSSRATAPVAKPALASVALKRPAPLKTVATAESKPNPASSSVKVAKPAADEGDWESF